MESIFMTEIYSLPIGKKSKPSKGVFKRIIACSVLGIALCLGGISIAGRAYLSHLDHEQKNRFSNPKVDRAIRKLMRYHGVNMVKISGNGIFYIWRDNQWIRVREM